MRQKVVIAISKVQIEFGVDRDFAHGDLALACGERDSGLETGRPGSSEQLFRIGADAGRAGRCQLDVEMTVAAAREAVLAAASRAGSGGIDHISFSGFGLGFHIVLFPVLRG